MSSFVLRADGRDVFFGSRSDCLDRYCLIWDVVRASVPRDFFPSFTLYSVSRDTSVVLSPSYVESIGGVFSHV